MASITEDGMLRTDFSWQRMGQRPWLSLYNRFLRKDNEEQPTLQVPLALIQHLPDEMLLSVLSLLPAYHLGKVACVCKQWRALVEHPRLWEHACMESFSLQHPNRQLLHKMVVTSFKRSWKRLFLEHPHVRFHGLYVSRNTYVKSGISEWSRSRNPVHVVVYYRYYRFFPDGTVLYRTSPYTVSKIAGSMQGPRASFFMEDQVTPARSLAQSHVFVGRYLIKGTKVWSVIRYPNSRSTEIRVRMGLRSTCTGANNRLDVESLESFDRELGLATNMDGSGAGQNGQNAVLDEDLDNEPQGQGVSRKQYRIPTSCVFVPWEQVQKSVLNLPHSEMDFFMPG